MTRQKNQGQDSQRDKSSVQHKPEQSQAPLQGQMPELLGPADLAFRGGTVEAQATTMERLDTVQRQAMTQKIGVTQGNRHVQRVLGAMSPSSSPPNRAATPKLPFLQAKLTVNAPDDQYEREADSMAEAVMRMPAAAPPPPAEGGTANGEETGTIARMPQVSRLQRAGQGTVEASSDVESRIASMKGGGQPLPEGDRTFFEERMGADFSGVRIHNSTEAAQTSQDLQARAFTVGSDIAFNDGEYQPGSDEGRKLLAHELTHTIQQGGAAISAKRIQRSADEGICPTCGKAGKVGETCDGCGTTFAPVQRKALDGAIQRQTILEAEMPQAAPLPAEAQQELNEGGGTPEGAIAAREAKKRAAEAGEGGQEGEQASEQAGPATRPTLDAALEQANGKDSKLGAAPEAAQKGAGAEGEATLKGTAEPGAAPKGEGEQAAAQKGAADQAGPQATGAQAQGALATMTGAMQGAKAETQAATNDIAGEIGGQKDAIAGQQAEAAAKAQAAQGEIANSLSSLEALASAPVQFPEEEVEAAAPAAPDMVVSRKVDDEGEGESEPPIDLEANKAECAAMVGQFVSQASSGVTTIAAIGQNAQARITPAAEAAKASITAAMEQQRATLQASIEQLRTQIQGEADTARGQVESQFQTTVTAVEAATQAARTKIEADYQTKLTELTTLETTKSTEITTQFTTAATDVRTAGDTVGQEAITIGEGFKTQYQAETYPEPGFFDGDDYYENKRKAKLDAADQVANGYRDEFKKKAEDTATQMAGGSPDVVNEMKTRITNARTSMEQEKTTALQALDQAHQQSMTTAEQTKTSQLQALDQSLQGSLDSVSQLETRLMTQLTETGQQRTMAVDRDAQQASASLQEAVSQSTAALQGQIQSFVSQVQSRPAPLASELAGVLAGAQAEIGGLVAQTQANLETQLASIEQSITESGAQAVEALAAITQQGQEQLTPIGEQFTTSTTELVESTTKSFTDLQTSHEQSSTQQAEATSQKFTQVYTDTQTQVDEITTCLGKGLGDFIKDFTDGPEGLRKALDKEREEIPTKAQEAADKVQPAWKKIVAVILVVIITVIVAVAIAALVASGVGLGLGLLLAAGIGALGGVAKGMINNWAAGEDLFKDFWKNAALGALDGMLQFVGGRFVQGLKLPDGGFKQMAVEAAVDTVSGTITDIAGLAMDGQLTWQSAFNSVMTNAISGVFSLGSAGAVARTTGGLPDGSWKKAGAEFLFGTVADTGAGVTTAAIKGEEIDLLDIAGNAALENFVSAGAETALTRGGITAESGAEKINDTFNITPPTTTPNTSTPPVTTTTTPDNTTTTPDNTTTNTTTPEVTNTPPVNNTPEVTNTPPVNNTPEVTNTPPVNNTPENTNTPPVNNTPETTNTPPVTNTPETTHTPTTDKPVTGREMAQQMGYPEAPTGYHWARNGDDVILKRNPGNADTLPPLQYDPTTGQFKPKADANDPTTQPPSERRDILDKLGGDKVLDNVSAATLDHLGSDLCQQVANKYGEQSIEILKLIERSGTGTDPKLVIERLDTAFDFYAAHNFRDNTLWIPGHLQGIDFNQPVEVTTIPKGTVLEQWQAPGGSQGSYYAEAGTLPTNLGIHPQATDKSTGAVVDKTAVTYIVVNDDVPGLKTTAASIADTWSVSGQSHMTEGGAFQYYSPTRDSFKPATQELLNQHPQVATALNQHPEMKDNIDETPSLVEHFSDKPEDIHTLAEAGPKTLDQLSQKELDAEQRVIDVSERKQTDENTQEVTLPNDHVWKETTDPESGEIKSCRFSTNPKCAPIPLNDVRNAHQASQDRMTNRTDASEFGRRPGESSGDYVTRLSEQLGPRAGESDAEYRARMEELQQQIQNAPDDSFSDDDFNKIAELEQQVAAKVEELRQREEHSDTAESANERAEQNVQDAARLFNGTETVAGGKKIAVKDPSQMSTQDLELLRDHYNKNSTQNKERLRLIELELSKRAEQKHIEESRKWFQSGHGGQRSDTEIMEYLFTNKHGGPFKHVYCESKEQAERIFRQLEDMAMNGDNEFGTQRPAEGGNLPFRGPEKHVTHEAGPNWFHFNADISHPKADGTNESYDVHIYFNEADMG